MENCVFGSKNVFIVAEIEEGGKCWIRLRADTKSRDLFRFVVVVSFKKTQNNIWTNPNFSFVSETISTLSYSNRNLGNQNEIISANTHSLPLDYVQKVLHSHYMEIGKVREATSVLKGERISLP